MKALFKTACGASQLKDVIEFASTYRMPIKSPRSIAALPPTSGWFTDYSYRLFSLDGFEYIDAERVAIYTERWTG
jgi:hypothetical protein